MNEKIKDEDVSKFLKAIIEIGGINSVDDSPDKYIRRGSGDGEPASLTVDGVAHPLAIYGTQATDAIIINPFAEGDLDASKNVWFYSTRNVVLGGLLGKLMKELIKIGADSHLKKKNEKLDQPLEAIKLLESVVEDIDVSTIKEFDKIAKELRDFIVIHYNKTTKRGEVSCLIFNKVRRKQFPAIRVKSWAVFEKLLGKILGTTDLSTFSEGANTVGIPVLETFTKILVKIYRAIKEPLTVIGVTLPQLGELESHIKYLGKYYLCARWCVGSVPDKVEDKNDMTPPWVVPVVGGVPATQTSIPMVNPTPLPTPIGFGSVPMGGSAIGSMSAPAPMPFIGAPQIPSVAPAPLMSAPVAEVPVAASTIPVFTGSGVPAPAMNEPVIRTDNPFARP